MIVSYNSTTLQLNSIILMLSCQRSTGNRSTTHTDHELLSLKVSRMYYINNNFN